MVGSYPEGERTIPDVGLLLTAAALAIIIEMPLFRLVGRRRPTVT